MQNTLYFLLSLLLFCGSCASFTSFQTAELTKKDSSSITASGSLLFSLPETENIYEEADQLVTQIMLRHGITKKSEVQAILSVNAFNINYKHLIHSSGHLIASYGLGLGYGFLASSFDDQIHVADLPLSFYITYMPKKHFGVTLTPKLMYRFIGDESTLVGGGSLNLALGNKVRFIPEGVLYYDVVIGNLFTGGGFAVAF